MKKTLTILAAILTVTFAGATDLTGWKMQRLEEDVWVDMDEKPFATMGELITYYKEETKRH